MFNFPFFAFILIILSAIFFFNENGLDKTTEFHMKSSILRLVFLSNFNNSRSIFFYHYKKRVFLHNKKVLKYSYNGKFRQADGIDYALRVLQRDIHFKYERANDEEIIYIN